MFRNEYQLTKGSETRLTAFNKMIEYLVGLAPRSTVDVSFPDRLSEGSSGREVAIAHASWEGRITNNKLKGKLLTAPD